MQKIFKYLQLPAVALLIIAIIYGGLTLRDLKNQTTDLKKQSQILNFKNNDLNSKLSVLEKNIVDNEAVNESLKNDLSDAKNQLASTQKQIAYLQNQINLKAVLGASTENIPTTVQAEPAVITKTITKTKNVVIEKNQATLTIQNVGSYNIDLQAGDSAWTVLQRASQQNNFALNYEMYSFGPFIKGIGGINPSGNQYWAFYFNGTFSNVGAGDQPVTKGDSMFWQLATF